MKNEEGFPFTPTFIFKKYIPFWDLSFKCIRTELGTTKNINENETGKVLNTAFKLKEMLACFLLAKKSEFIKMMLGVHLKFEF